MLDLLQGRARANAALIYSHTYHQRHGVPGRTPVIFMWVLLNNGNKSDELYGAVVRGCERASGERCAPVAAISRAPAARIDLPLEIQDNPLHL